MVITFTPTTPDMTDGQELVSSAPERSGESVAYGGRVRHLMIEDTTPLAALRGELASIQHGLDAELCLLCHFPTTTDIFCDFCVPKEKE